MTYGKSIGKKFYEDGSVRRYPGNTIIANIPRDSEAQRIMVELKRMVIDSGLGDNYIFLPEDSYHMTVIRGVNDQVRREGFWPDTLAKDSSMSEVDDHIVSAVESVGMLGRVRMRFSEMYHGGSALVALLEPYDSDEERKLRGFRNAVAEAIGLFLPKHDEYKYHVSLAYIRIVPEGDDRVRLDDLMGRMNELLRTQSAFETEEPFVAFYDDMLRFSPQRIPRN
ncbi:MAG: DUF1868 domain-containing protein [Ruminococcaceae bacterium]|nr:DUF1868 domain-containing protein [Oscillospiraceae bacterium]